MLVLRSVLAAASAVVVLGACGSIADRLDATPCKSAVERVPGSGTVQCENGLVHRPVAGVCPKYVASADQLEPSSLRDLDQCYTDSACTEKPYGYCFPGLMPYGGTATPNTCKYGCTVDAECPDGTICVCGEQRGDCHPSDCATNDDCPEGSHCAEYAPTCSRPSGFACQTTADACQLDSDCGHTFACALDENGNRYCTLPYCAG